MTGSDHLHLPGTWQWWGLSLAGVMYRFLGIMGFFYVTGAPMTRSEEVPPAIGGALAAQLTVAYRQWRRAKQHKPE